MRAAVRALPKTGVLVSTGCPLPSGPAETQTECTFAMTGTTSFALSLYIACLPLPSWVAGAVVAKDALAVFGAVVRATLDLVARRPVIARPAVAFAFSTLPVAAAFRGTWSL